MKKHFFFSLGLMMMALGGQQVQAETIDLSTFHNRGDIILSDGDILTGSSNDNTVRNINITDGATIVLDNVHIRDYEEFAQSGITCLGDATIILKNNNKVRARQAYYAGIYVPRDHTLTIEGNGSLDVKGYENHRGTLTGTGIGGDLYRDGGNIIINNGTITATGGETCPAIGSCGSHACGDITIHGGTINVIGGNSAPAIGANGISSCGNITIDNACGSLNLQATKGSHSSICIGGNSNTVSTIGTVTILGTVQPNGISTSPYEITTPKWDGDLSNVTAPVVAENGIIIHGTLSTPQKISIAPHASVYLTNAVIRGNINSSREWAGLTCLGDAMIYLQGNNMVQGCYNSSAIYVPKSKTLYITGNGSLTAIARGQGAGIGAGYGSNKSCGTIYIMSGTIEAHGGHYAAGIGGAFLADCGYIYISRCAQVTAYKGYEAPNSIGEGFGATNLINNLVQIGTDCTAPFGNPDYVYNRISTSPFIYPEPEEPIEPEEPTCLVPTNLQQTGESEPYAVSVSWTQGGSETKWQVGWRLLGSTEDYSSYPISHTSDEITGLTPDTDYEIAVRAQCDNWGNELSEWSEPIIVTTMALPQPCGMPRNLQTVSITENSITILFAPGSANNTEWEVACKIRATQQDVFRETGTDMIVTIPNLTPNTAYNIWVGAHCDEGSSDYNVLYNITTLEAEPEPEPEPEPCLPVTNVIVSDITSTSATVSFTPGSEDQTEWYVYCYIPDERAVFTEYVEETSVTIPDLEPNTEYMVTVKTLCDEEASDWATDVPFTTLEETGIEEIVDGRSSLVDGQKILHEGHLYFLRDGKIFNAQGARVK